MNSARRADFDQHAQPALLWSPPASNSEQPQRTTRKSHRGQDSTPRAQGSTREYASDARATPQPSNPQQYYASTSNRVQQPTGTNPSSSHVRGEVSSNAATYGSSQGRPTPSQTPTPTNVYPDVYQLRAYMQQTRPGKTSSKEKLDDKDRRPGSATPQPTQTSAPYPVPAAPTQQGAQYASKEPRTRDASSRRETKESDRRREERYRDTGRDTDESDREKIRRQRDEMERERSRDRTRQYEEQYRDRTKDRARDPRHRPTYAQNVPMSTDMRGKESDSDSSNRRMFSAAEGHKKYYSDDRVHSSRFLPNIFSRSSRKTPTPQPVQTSNSQGHSQPVQAPNHPINHAQTHPPAEAKSKHGSTSTKFMLYPQKDPQSGKHGVDDPRSRREAHRPSATVQPGAPQSNNPASMQYATTHNAAMHNARATQAGLATTTQPATSAAAYASWSPPLQDPYRQLQSPISPLSGLQGTLQQQLSSNHPSAPMATSNNRATGAPSVQPDHPAHRNETNAPRDDRQVHTSASNGSPGQGRRERSSLEQARSPPPTANAAIGGYSPQGYSGSGSQQTSAVQYQLAESQRYQDRAQAVQQGVRYANSHTGQAIYSNNVSPPESRDLAQKGGVLPSSTGSYAVAGANNMHGGGAVPTQAHHVAQPQAVPDTYSTRPDLLKQPSYDQGRRSLQSPGLSIATTVDTAATTVTSSNYQASANTILGVSTNPSNGSREQVHGAGNSSTPVASVDPSKHNAPYPGPMSAPPTAMASPSPYRNRPEADMGRPVPVHHSNSMPSPAPHVQQHAQGVAGVYPTTAQLSQRSATTGIPVAPSNRSGWENVYPGAGPGLASTNAKPPSREGPAPKFPVIETPSTPSSGRTAGTPPFLTPSSNVMGNKTLPPATPQSIHASIAAQPIAHTASSSSKPVMAAAPSVQSGASNSHSSSSNSHPGPGAHRPNQPSQVMHTPVSHQQQHPSTLPISGANPRSDPHHVGSPQASAPYPSVTSPIQHGPTLREPRTQQPPQISNPNSAHSVFPQTHEMPPTSVPKNPSKDSSIHRQSRNKENSQPWFSGMIGRNPSRDSQDTKDTGSLRAASIMGEAPVRKPSKLSKQPPKRSQTHPVPPQMAAPSGQGRGRTLSDTESSRMDALRHLMPSRASVDAHGRRNNSSSSVAQAAYGRAPSAPPGSRDSSQERKKKGVFSRFFSSGPKSSDIKNPQQTWYTSQQQGSSDTLRRETSRQDDRYKRESVLPDVRRTVDTKVVPPPVSTKGNVPPTLTIPLNIPSTEKRSPAGKTFKPNFRFLAPKRHRTMSAASLEAMDGTALNGLSTHPSMSTLTSTMLTTSVQPLPTRDPLNAAEEWRNNGETSLRGRGSGTRRVRPGVTFDVEEDPPDDVLEARIPLARAASGRLQRRRPSK
ncbi:hypothetical protein PUNSTDRAFT_136165 [Punctularia strigosozonata HHB-11173 SS5]|uniref:uncharacterized protein n=1 Tax=Punctularia strigosozonata (strain HHB-11173) TaxID=741275 RepID=UPI00044165A9|nr:uncharacterized protein PUNSTDRAFT_136165 [Punctularia strigosozonata HHB-11173 SS5]EIN07485.1 hypothetical protein PUNSTDRAFT_136165 [Punctularia strigosozonata HHB-11173 SS5]